MTKTKSNDSSLTPLTQKTFISLSLVAYILQVLLWLTIVAAFYGPHLRLSQFSLMIGQSILLPIILFVVAFLLTTRSAPLLQRVTKAAIAASIGLALQMVLMQLFMRTVQLYLPYGDAQWYSPWQELLPGVVTLVLFIAATYILRYTRLLSLSTSRMAACVVVFAAFGMTALLTVHDMLRYYSMVWTHGALASSVYYAIAAVIALVAAGLNYYMIPAAGRSRQGRLYVSVVYGMMAYFIISIMYSGLGIALRWNIHTSLIPDSGTLLVVGLVLYAVMVLWHKKLGRI